MAISSRATTTYSGLMAKIAWEKKSVNAASAMADLPDTRHEFPNLLY